MHPQRSLRRLAFLPALVAVLSAVRPGPVAAQAAASPITFGVGSFQLTLGGYIKLDLIHDFDPNSNPDSFDPRNIPVDGSEGTNTRIHARQTRLSLGLDGPVDGKPLKVFIEGDFYGTGNAFRLRHAYGQYGILLAGQTWTTFMDELNIPATIDFESPTAAPLVRQGLLRITTTPSKSSELAFAVEESDPEILNPTGVPGNLEKAWPDLTGRYRLKYGRGHVQLSGFVGRTSFKDAAGTTSSVTIGGVLLSTRLKLFDKDAAYLEVAYGPGLGRYRGAASAALDAAGNLETVDVVALTAGYQRFWSPRWSSNLVISPAWLLNDVGDPATTNNQLTYAAVNLLYWFLPQRAWIGGEYLYGRREVRSGAEGTGNRIQFAVQFILMK